MRSADRIPRCMEASLPDPHSVNTSSGDPVPLPLRAGTSPSIISQIQKSSASIAAGIPSILFFPGLSSRASKPARNLPSTMYFAARRWSYISSIWSSSKFGLRRILAIRRPDISSRQAPSIAACRSADFSYTSVFVKAPQDSRRPTASSLFAETSATARLLISALCCAASSFGSERRIDLDTNDVCPANTRSTPCRETNDIARAESRIAPSTNPMRRYSPRLPSVSATFSATYSAFSHASAISCLQS